MFRELVMNFLGVGREEKKANKKTCNEAQKEFCKINFGEYFEWACENCK